MGFIEEAVKLIISDKFAIVFKSFDNPNDLQQFKQHPRGTLFVFDNIFSGEGKKCFMVCFVNRINRTIFYGTTQGDTVGCDFYQTLAQLNDNGNFFACTLFKYKCERSDELFVIHLCEIFTTGMVQYIRRAPSDRELIQQYKLSFLNGSPRLTQESHQILRAISKKEYSNPTQTNQRGPVYNEKPHQTNQRGPVYNEKQHQTNHRGPVYNEKQHQTNHRGPVYNKEKPHQTNQRGPVYNEKQHQTNQRGPVYNEKQHQTNQRGPVYNKEKPHQKSRTTYGWKDEYYYDDDDDEDMGESAPRNKHTLRDDFKSSSYSHRPIQRSYSNPGSDQFQKIQKWNDNRSRFVPQKQGNTKLHDDFRSPNYKRAPIKIIHSNPKSPVFHEDKTYKPAQSPVKRNRSWSDWVKESVLTM